MPRTVQWCRCLVVTVCVGSLFASLASCNKAPAAPCENGDCAVSCTGATCRERACGDRDDNDGDGTTDCADADCNGRDCGAYCRCEDGGAVELNCVDGFDNDLDGDFDCADTNCASVSCGTGCVCANGERVETNCNDGADNDGDGTADCDDLNCNGATCIVPEVCFDALDNDGDGATDCADPDCDTSRCGAGCVCTSGVKSEIYCADGTDNDGDGLTDCDDGNCVAQAHPVAGTPGTWELGSWRALNATATSPTVPLQLLEDSATAGHMLDQYVNVPPSPHWQLSFEARPIGKRSARVYLMDSANQSTAYVATQCTFEGSGSVRSSWMAASSADIAATSTLVTGGWYRCTLGGVVNATLAAEQLRIVIYMEVDGQSTYPGDGASGLELRNVVLSGDLPAPSCSTKAFACCDYVQELFALREGFGAHTVGGVGGDVYVVTTLGDAGFGSLRFAAEDPSAKPYWITIDPSLSGQVLTPASQIYVRSRRTIDGRGAELTLNAYGFNIFGVSDVILNDIAVRDLVDHDDDNVSIGVDASRIWLHRVSLSGQGSDGLVDVTTGATDVTIDWSRFLDHDKVMIVNSYSTSPDPMNPNAEILNGHELDNYERDKNVRVTLHHNVFTSTNQRHPRSVFGKIHMYNNVLTDWGSYGLASSFRAETLVEGNVLTHSGAAGASAFLTQVGIDPEPGYIRAANNRFGGTASGSGSQPELVFVPPYAYACDEASLDLQTRVLAQAGVEGDGAVNRLSVRGSGCPSVVPWSSVTGSLGSYSATQGTLTTASGVLTFVEDTTNDYHQLNNYSTYSSATTWRLSFDAMPLGNRNVRTYVLRTSTQSDNYVATDFFLNGIGSTSTPWTGPLSSGVAAAIYQLPSGWYHCVLSGTVSATPITDIRLAFNVGSALGVFYTGDGSSGLKLRNVQLEHF